MVRQRFQSRVTEDQDKEIMALLLGLNGKARTPKQVVVDMHLSSVWVVYGAIRRYKYRKGWARPCATRSE